MSIVTPEPAVSNGIATPAGPKPKITTQVLAQIESLRTRGALKLPADYSPGNALNSAWLALQEVQNMDRKPIFKDGVLTNVVTQVSIANALLDMVVQGLNPSKKQGYFIVYGDKLVWQRSYFGDQALAERVKPGITLYYDVIRKGDEFGTEKIRSRTAGFVDTVAFHKKPWPKTSDEIIGAYCGAIDEHGEDIGIVLMDIERIKRSWGMSKTYKADGAGTHNKFPDEMVLRTVIRRRCKPIINTSSDEVLLESLRRQEEESAEGELAEEVSAHANREVLALAAPAVEAPAPSVPSEPAPATIEEMPENPPATQGTLAAEADF